MSKKRNVTLKLDERLLHRSRLAAVTSDESLSEWVSRLISRALGADQAKRRALRLMDEGFDLGGSPVAREDTHER